VPNTNSPAVICHYNVDPESARINWLKFHHDAQTYQAKLMHTAGTTESRDQLHHKSWPVKKSCGDEEEFSCAQFATTRLT
jgi:hypothetical protein